MDVRSALIHRFLPSEVRQAESWRLWQTWLAEHPQWDEAPALRGLADYARDFERD